MKWVQQVLILAMIAGVSAETDCNSECAFGITGIQGLAEMLRGNKDNNFCSHYAASVTSKDTWKACGYTDIADMVEACLFGTPPKHCFRQKNAGIAVVIVSHLAAVSVWFSIINMISKLV